MGLRTGYLSERWFPHVVIGALSSERCFLGGWFVAVSSFRDGICLIHLVSQLEGATANEMQNPYA